MLQAAFFSFIAVALISTLAVQVPLTSGSHWQAEHHQSILAAEDTAEWRFDRLPDTNTTDHLVFETVHSLLRQWPNTRMRNGHNVVPGTIPTGTLLYHPAGKKELPLGPEWVMTDPEHSYAYCFFVFNYFRQPCWYLTLTTTRPLKIVYFDGSSAAKLPDGSLDAQDLIIWGEPGAADVPTDVQRIHDLCEWGRSLDVDGFVRLGMDLEVMLCDFASGVRPVSFVNLTIQEYRQRDLPTLFKSPVLFEAINAGSWHNQFPGDMRIQLDLTGLVSFYDTELVPSLVDIRAGQARRDHRVGNISSEDLSAVKSRLEAVLMRPEGLSSGVDWRTLIQVIVDRYAQRLELARYLLNSSVTDPDEIMDIANKTQYQLRVMLTPYLYTGLLTDQAEMTDMDWAIPVYRLCATTHTRSMGPLVSMTDSEKLLLQVVRGTTREICRTVTKMWAAGVNAGIDSLLNRKESLDITEIRLLWTNWAEDLDRLMTWLDWSVWVKCNPGCNFEEMCYLPTWPIGFPIVGLPPPSTPDLERPTSVDFRSMLTERLAERMGETIQQDEWVRPQPKCISRFAPYEF